MTRTEQAVRKASAIRPRAEGEVTSFRVIARCDLGRGPCEIRFSLETDLEGRVPVRYMRWSPAEGAMVPKDEDTLTPALDAIPYLVWCVKHRSMLHGRRVRVTLTNGPCGPDCREATGSTCRCSCGGANHGEDAA